jgi:hypothetical protein
MARELVDRVKRNVSIDWTQEESMKAKLRVIVQRIMRYDPAELCSGRPRRAEGPLADTRFGLLLARGFESAASKLRDAIPSAQRRLGTGSGRW